MKLLLLALALGLIATSPPTMTVTAPSMYTHNSYRGTPDLGLTLAINQAGTVNGRFKADRLFTVLAGSKAAGEKKRLAASGKARMAAFMQTFTFAMRDLSQLFQYNHVKMPAEPRMSPKDGRALALAIYHDGIMPDGKYDCGYMMEHLMTHPIHVVLMHDINNTRAYGMSHNASFHTILTRVVVDLKNAYRNA